MADELLDDTTTPAGAQTEPPASESASTSAADSSSGVNKGSESPADQDVKKPSLLDVVKDVVKAKPDPSSESDPEQGQQQAPTDKPNPETSETPPPEVPKEFAKHPAWQRIMREREAFKPDALQYRMITKFMQDNGLNVDEVSGAIQLIALVKQDPAKALESFRKTVGELENALGETLPQDLQEQVDAGALTEEHAKELSRLRASNKMRETRDATDREARQRAAEKAQGEKLASDIQGAVDSWESVKAKSDPDFNAKRQEIISEMRSIVVARGKLLSTPEDARAVANEAYKTVSGRYQRRAPAPKAGNLTEHGNSGVTEIPAAPKTSREAALLALKKTRSG